MDKVKDFVKDNKKIIIPVAIVLVLLIAVGIYFISQPNEDTNKKAETQTEEKVDISKDDKKEEDKNKDSEDKKADKKDTADNSNADASAQNDNAPASKPSSNNSGSNQSASKPADKPSQPAKPAHSHSWKNHTATKQVWVNNWVEEPVYETQKVKVGQTYICNCGFTATGILAMNDHCAQHLINGEPDNYQAVPRYEQQTVQVGTNKVDKGHYETQSYTDYQYCDCGARK